MLLRRLSARQSRSADLRFYANLWLFVKGPRGKTTQVCSQEANQSRPFCWTRARHKEKVDTQASPVLDKYKRFLTPKHVTCPIENLCKIPEKSLPTRVQLVGYIGNWSHLSKQLSFATLKDPSQEFEIQLISAPSKDDSDELSKHRANRSVRANSPVHVGGHLRRKSKTTSADDDSVNGCLEQLEVSLVGADAGIETLNDFPHDIILKRDTVFGPSQRHLQLRNDTSLRQILATRAEMQDQCRSAIRTQSRMVEIETPLLFKSTSEGAREFLIPTRQHGLAYALPQSPQQFKQLLMSSGIAGYFQFAKCFRDEDLRADRQPEFTQLDMELAFASSQDVMRRVEDVILHLWQRQLNIDLPSPIQQKTYGEVIAKYGSDKPDLRIPVPPFLRIDYMLPVDLTKMITEVEAPLIEAMVLQLHCSPQETRSFIANFLDSPAGQPFLRNPGGAPAVFVYDCSKPLQGLSAFGFEAAEYLENELQLEDGNLVVLQARDKTSPTGGSTMLGKLRTALFNAAVEREYLPAPSWRQFEPLWVTDFPLFSPASSEEPGQASRAGLAATHHPFTSPKTVQDADLLLTEPLKAIGDHYDLVINGEEIGGGSRRIHHSAMQELIFRDVLQMEENNILEFSHLLEALRAGCPPHAGIALGFDRLVAMIMSCRLEKAVTLRDVIAFPKTGKGDDPMVSSPSQITAEALRTYHLAFTK